MIKLLIEILTQMAPLPDSSDIERCIMVIDYILCTIPVAPGEEVEVLQQVLATTRLLHKDWHPVFNEKTVAMAIEGRVGDTVRGTAVTHRGLCTKRAALYREKEPSIVAVGDTIRANLTSPDLPSNTTPSR